MLGGLEPSCSWDQLVFFVLAFFSRCLVVLEFPFEQQIAWLEWDLAFFEANEFFELAHIKFAQPIFPGADHILSEA